MATFTRSRRWAVCFLLIALLAGDETSVWSQTPPPSAPKSAVEGKDGWGQIDQRLVFLTVELSTVESSITATNRALKANGYKLADLTSDAEKARERNVQMDRQGGGPVPWTSFYGRTAKDFFYHPNDDGSVYVNPAPMDQRPPQFDYIYRANEDNRAKAEDAAAAVGTKIEDLLAHRKVLEGEQLALWCKIAFRAVASKELAIKPLYRFDAVTKEPGDSGKAHLAAVKAGSAFIHAVDSAIAQAQTTVDADEKSALDDLLHATTAARADADDRLLQLPAIATELADTKSPIGQFRQSAKQLQDFAENMVDAYHTSTAADVDDDPARKSSSRGQFQQAISSYAEALLGADASLSAAAKAWSVTPDNTQAPAPPEATANAADSIPARLQLAKSDNQAELSKAKQSLVAVIDGRMNSAADAGDLNAVESLQLVKTSAARDGSIGEDVKDADVVAAKGRYDQAVNSANDLLATAYRQAIRDYTKARQFTEAQATQDEFKASGLSATPSAPTDQPSQGAAATPGAGGDTHLKVGPWVRLSRSLPPFLIGSRFSAQSDGVLLESAIGSRAPDMLSKDFVFDVEVNFVDHGDAIFVGLGGEVGGGRPAHQTSLKLSPPENGHGGATMTNNDEWGERNELGRFSEPGLYIVRVEKIGRSVIYTVGTEDNKQFTPMYTRGVVDIRKFNEELLDRSTHLYFCGGKDDIFTRTRLVTGDSIATATASVLSLPMGTYSLGRTLPTIMTGGSYNIMPEGAAPFRHDFESVSHAFLSADYTCDVTFDVHKDRTAFVGLGLAGNAKFLALDMRPDKEGVSVSLNHNEQWPKSFASIPEPGTYVARIDKVGRTVTFSVGTGEGSNFQIIASKTVDDIGIEAEELTGNSTHLILGGDTAYSKIAITPPIPAAPPHADAGSAPDVSESTAIAKVETKGRAESSDAAVQPSAAALAGTAKGTFNGWNCIINKKTGRYLFVISDNKNEGNVISVQPSNDSDNEKWKLCSLTGFDGVKLVNKYSNKIIGVRGGSKKAGMDVIEWNDWKSDTSYTKGSGENWKIEAAGDSFKIISEVSGLCLTERQGGQEKALQQPWKASDYQLWRIETSPR